MPRAARRLRQKQASPLRKRPSKTRPIANSSACMGAGGADKASMGLLNRSPYQFDSFGHDYSSKPSPKSLVLRIGDNHCVSRADLGEKVMGQRINAIHLFSIKRVGRHLEITQIKIGCVGVGPHLSFKPLCRATRELGVDRCGMIAGAEDEHFLLRLFSTAVEHMCRSLSHQAKSESPSPLRF